ELVDLARLSASGANLQPLKYILTCRPELNAEIFRCLGWAAYLQDWAGPQSGERPAAYIVILGDSNISKDFGVDHGIAAQSILLGARDKGLAGCMIGSINRKDLRAILNVQSHLKILLALAIGKPKEKIVIETVGPDGDIRYWRDEQAVHHVPKRSLSEIIVASHAV
ncbi:MAG: nitroreductase family protein, partial [Desulfobacterales bacterium]